VLGFADGDLSGSTGCNTFGGSYTQSGSSLTITLGPSTLIGCPPPLDAQEQAVLAALPKTASFTVDGGALTLLDSEGAHLLEYEHLEPVSLVGPDWRVTGINNGKQAVASVIAGSELTAAFGTDGTVSGSAGCNTYSAGYTLEGDVLTVKPAASTRKLCESPAGVMEQEPAFLHALERSVSVEADGGGVTLRDADGATQLTLAPV
jgi:heat shock protein HslJ